MAKWVLKKSKIDTDKVAETLNIYKATAVLLEHRKIKSKEEARGFLKGQEIDRQAIFKIKDGELALDIITKGIENKKKIVVYGDYDVDGITSSSILYKTIKELGGDVSYYLPHRINEGYGLIIKNIEKLHEQGKEIILTCDNGISSIKEIERANELGMEVIVIDHHEPAFTEDDGKRKDKLPSASAIIDPKRNDCEYPFKSLCAAGLSYYFSLALLDKWQIKNEVLEKQLIVFAMIATICDVVDLLGENRDIAKLGLKEIKTATNLGVRALAKVNGIELEDIKEYNIGFLLGPSLNSVGRLDDATKAVDFLVSEDEDYVEMKAKEVFQLNARRKELTEDGVKTISGLIQQQIEEKGKMDKVVVVYNEDMHESLAGIIAGKVKERYNHPTIVITKAEDSAKGSGRSIEGYNLFEAMFANREIFSRFGGHAMAAGFSIDKDQIPLMTERLNEYCELTEEDFTPTYKVNQILDFSEITLDLEKEIDWFAPFGKANEKPLFASTNILISRLSLIGPNKTVLRFDLKDEKTGVLRTALSFDGYDSFVDMLKSLYDEEICGKMLSSGRIDERIDLVYTINKNTYNGYSSVQLMIKDFRLAK